MEDNMQFVVPVIPKIEGDTYTPQKLILSMEDIEKANNGEISMCNLTCRMHEWRMTYTSILEKLVKQELQQIIDEVVTKEVASNITSIHTQQYDYYFFYNEKLFLFVAGEITAMKTGELSYKRYDMSINMKDFLKNIEENSEVNSDSYK